jgi:hypothetical protein
VACLRDNRWLTSARTVRCVKMQAESQRGIFQTSVSLIARLEFRCLRSTRRSRETDASCGIVVKSTQLHGTTYTYEDGVTAFVLWAAMR